MMSSPKRNTDPPKEVVLFVKPEEIGTIWLDVSTLIGKVKPAYKKREDPVAIFSMLDKDSKKELWKVIKDYSSLTTLDHTLRSLLAQHDIPKLPERVLFQSHAPARIDARKEALQDYFFTILKLPNLPYLAARALCEFMSTDMIDPMDIPDTISRREGYLTKRGKKIRGWKVRFFIIENDCLNYYDKPGGDLQGSISLVGAKLGRQTSKADTEHNPTDETLEKSFRHAFLLVEPKKKDYIRHVLCAESDEERDSWIQALMEVVALVTKSPLVPPGNELRPSSPKKQILSAPFSPVDATHETGGRVSAIPPPQHHMTSPNNWVKNKAMTESSPSIHEILPTGSVDEGDEASKEKKQKKKGFFASFRNRNHNTTNAHPANLNVVHEPGSMESFQSTPYSAVEQKPLSSRDGLLQSSRADGPGLHALGISLEEAISSQHDIPPFTPSETSLMKPSSMDTSGSMLKRVFGVPLGEALALASKNVHHCKVPAIVYRCIELLKMRDAIFEEGIFRLSGSTATIRNLKDRFNREYDVDLVHCETIYDIHAVAGLLKLYLREIPTLILSSYLAPEFREAVDIEDPTTKLLKLKSLVQELPRENRDLLCVLCSLLTEIISNAEINKMTLRNVGIVFAPTLNISAHVLIHFLTDFDAIFGDEDDLELATEVTNLNEVTKADDDSDSGSDYGDEPGQEADNMFASSGVQTVVMSSELSDSSSIESGHKNMLVQVGEDRLSHTNNIV